METNPLFGCIIALGGVVLLIHGMNGLTTGANTLYYVFSIVTGIGFTIYGMMNATSSTTND